MFLVRSVFWLTVAYMVIRPGVDFNDAASALSSQAMAAGQQVIAEQVANIECDSFQCAGGKAALAALTTSPSVGSPMHSMPTSDPVPLPRPRPDRAG
jgi:hypothetical protein